MGEVPKSTKDQASAVVKSTLADKPEKLQISSFNSELRALLGAVNWFVRTALAFTLPSQLAAGKPPEPAH